MAKQSGIFKVQGTIDDVTFIKRGDKYFVRKKGGVSKQRIMSESNFVRTRENMREFGNVALAGKILRTAGASVFRKAYDPKLCNRLTAIFTKIKNLDQVSERGNRRVAIGLATAGGKNLFQGFHFNDNAHLNSVLFAPYQLAAATGTVTIAEFVPREMVNVPANASHVGFSAAFLVVDFATGNSELAVSPMEVLEIDMTSNDVLLVPDAVPSLPGIKMHLLMIAFFQETNGIQYSLNDGGFNVVTMVGIA